MAYILRLQDNKSCHKINVHFERLSVNYVYFSEVALGFFVKSLIVSFHNKKNDVIVEHPLKTRRE